MRFYTEVYNADKLKDDLFLKYSVYSNDLDTMNAVKTGYKKIQKLTFEPLLIDFDCADLPSGNYRLNIEINKKDKTNLKAYSNRFSVLHPHIDYKNLYEGDAKFETSFVQRLNIDELDYALKAIFPRVGNHLTETVNHVVKSKEIKVKRMFLYGFWAGFNPEHPNLVYDKYMEVARAIDLKYANNVGHGFQTERGYFFLKYGRPDNVISVEDEPSAPPYEIWIYNYLAETQQTRVKFLFYNPSLVTNDYFLLHSTCRGERQNPRWEVELYKNDFTSPAEVNQTTVRDGNNRNASRIFSDN